MTTTDEAIACRACGSALAFGSPFCGACGSPVQSSSRSAHDGPGPQAALAAAGRVDVAGPGWRPISGGPLAGRAPARPGRRLAAYLIDGVCASLVVAVANAVFVSQLNSALMSGSSDAFAGATRAVMFGPLTAWIVGAVAMLMVEGATGATIGNAAMRIRSVSVTTGGPPGFGRALGRRFIEQLGSLVLVGAPIIAASSAWDAAELRQGWQDKIAGTTMVGVGPGAGSTPTSRQQLELAPPSAASTVVPADDRLMSTPLPPAASPSTAARPAQEAVAGPGQAPLLPRSTGGLIATVPGFEAVAESALPFTPPPPVAVVVDELDEDLDHTRMSPAAARHARSYELRFDTGEVVMVDGSGLVGRSPTPRVGERVEHLVPIVDPARSVSKTHLAFGIGPDGFWVSDRDSTNGTRAVSETGVVTDVLGDVRVTVAVGGTVEFGERQFTVVTS